MASISNKVYHKQIKRSYDWSFVGAKLQLNGCYGYKDWRSYLPFKHQGHILGWFSNRTGTSFDAWKARENDLTLLPVPNLSLCHWSSKLFDLRAPSSTDVPVLLLNQPTNSPDRPPYISLKNLPREFDKRAKHFPFGDHFVYSHNLSRDYISILLGEYWSWSLLRLQKLTGWPPGWGLHCFFQFSLSSKFCIAKYVMLKVAIWFTRLSDTVSGPHLLCLYNISCVKYQTIKGQIIFSA